MGLPPTRPVMCHHMGKAYITGAYTVKNNVLGQHTSTVLHLQGKIYSPHAC